MPYYHQLAFINISLIFLAFASGLFRINMLDKASKIICVLMGLTLIEEIIAYYCAVAFHQNIPVLRVFNLIEIVMLSLYFNFSNKIFRKFNAGIYIAAVSLIIGLTDLILSKSLKHLSGFFMYYEGILIISISLFTLFQMVKDYPYVTITRIPHFWIAAIQIVFWCFTIMNWTFYDFFTEALPEYKLLISYSICGINYLFYLVIFLIYLRYPKMYQAYV